MRHLGDITKINWFEVEPVDCVTGGSPCQDLSVAGKRAGLAGERSGLYMEQIRCIKELRQRDIQSGRTGAMVRPRWMVWENVPGAFSSNGGKDFAAVLEEAVKIVEPQAPPIPVPDKGWPSAGCLSDVDGRWSIAWRVHDAQFWGVPQRRKRIALVCDFGGMSAPEVLFERKGLSRDTEQSGAQREETARTAGNGIEGASGFTNRGYFTGGITETLRSDPHGAYPLVRGIGNGQVHEAMTMAQEVSQTLNTMHDKQAILYQPKSAMEENWAESKIKNAIRAGESKMSHAVLCEDVSQQAWEEATGHPTESAGGYDRVAEGEGNCKKLRGIYNDKFQPIAFAQNQRDEVRDLKDKAGALAAEPGMKQQNFVAQPMTMQAIGEYKDCDVASSCKMQDYKDATDLVCEPVFERTIRWIVRRLTPMECERLQGYPDGWTDIGEWTDSKGKKHQTSDTSRYKALGNSIALPFWYWMMQNMAEYLPEKPTLGSLFDGIGGFPLCWERIHGKGTARWASEIEEFPMAVTKKRFGEG